MRLFREQLLRFSKRLNIGTMKRDLFWKLLEPEHARAEAFCRRLAGDPDEGDDLYQDSLIKAWHGFRSLRNHGAFRPWLYRIIVNVFKSRRRAPWWRRRVSFDDNRADGHLAYEQMTEIDRTRLLNRILDTLAPDEKALVVLFELEGWSIRELAIALGKTETALKSRLFRARRKMRREAARALSQNGLKWIEEGGEICVAEK